MRNFRQVPATTETPSEYGRRLDREARNSYASRLRAEEASLALTEREDGAQLARSRLDVLRSEFAASKPSLGDYFATVLPKALPYLRGEDQTPDGELTDIEFMRKDFPLFSICGLDCKRAIDSGYALYLEVCSACGSGSSEAGEVLRAVARTVQAYVFG